MPELTVMSPSRLRSRTRKLSSVAGYNSGTMQCFWGIELSEDNPEAEWNMREDDEEFGADRDYMVNELHIKIATLGPGLLKNEEHVVEVETQDMNQKVLKVPIVNMVAGVNSMMNLNMEFGDKCKVTFRLTAGSGPVYLSGFVLQEHPEEEAEDSQEESMYTETETTATDENVDSEELDEEDVEDEEEEDEKVKSKSGVKRKTGASPSVKISKSKRSKMETKEESEEEESEEEEEEDEEEEMDTGSRKKKGVPAVSPKPGKSPRGKAGKKSPAVKEDKKKAKKVKSK